MKVCITTNDKGLGLDIIKLFNEEDIEIIVIKNNFDYFIDNLESILKECDVFINCAYRQKLQSILFEKVYNLWKFEKKTIVNILTSALVFGGPNKEYIDDKKHLEQKTILLRTNDKEVRIINVYPNTLENTYLAQNQKLKFRDVSNVILYLLQMPHDIEIFQIGIGKTKLKIENTML